MTIDDLLKRIQANLNLEAEAEQEILEEIRGHLEEAVEAARRRGCDQAQALREAAAAFGIELAATALRATHAGWGALDGVAVAALPVLFALILRWLIFVPGGTALAWREALSRPALSIIAAAALLIPLLRFSRRRYVIALWAFFWGLSLATLIWPAVRW